MADEGTPEDVVRWAAALRGKREANRQIVEALHPEPDEPKPDEDVVEEEFMQRLLSPKPGHAELIRRLHPDEES